MARSGEILVFLCAQINLAIGKLNQQANGFFGVARKRLAASDIVRVARVGRFELERTTFRREECLVIFGLIGFDGLCIPIAGCFGRKLSND